MTTIPAHFVNYKSTQTFSKNNVPKMFIHRHNTRAGVYGKICVLQGTLKFYGFSSMKGDVEQEVIIKANEHVISPPQYWHKVEFLTDDCQFQVKFFADEAGTIVKKHLNERDNSSTK